MVELRPQKKTNAHYQLPRSDRTPDNKSILANTDWKKLWLESGQLSSSGRIDNHLDSSDSTLIDDGERPCNSAHRNC
uniref:Uncharacterized protein n=1 Tax=Anopheles quadriannulatus TaxID=34691 RepID=A0A182X8R0_ANOQN